MIESILLAGATIAAGAEPAIVASAPSIAATAPTIAATAPEAANDLVRGAIGGAFVIGVSFLAGFAVFRRSSAALCALLMVLAAAALEFSALGLFNPPSAKVLVALQGLFAASVLIYLSSTVGAAKRNIFIGTLIFAAALSMLGMGAINFFGKADLSGLMRNGLFGVVMATAGLAAVQSLRGDQGARLLLPGAVILAAAPLAGPVFSTTIASLTPHALFTFGVLAASLVALTETGPVAGGATPLTTPEFAEAGPTTTMEDRLLVSENQLAEVLDYAGIAVMDWNQESVHHTPSFSTLFDAEPSMRLSPTRLRDLVHPSDESRFKHDVFGRHEGDGAFDSVFGLRNGTRVRLRGARAVSADGDLERLVVFAEAAPDDSPKLWDAASVGAVSAAAVTGLAQTIDKTEAGVNAAENAPKADPATSQSRLFGPGQLEETAVPGGAMLHVADPLTDGPGAASGERRAQAGDDRRRANGARRRDDAATIVERGLSAGGAASALATSEPDIKAALAKGHLKAAFQPIVALSNRKIRGYEALLRATGGEASKAINTLPIEEIVRLADRQGQGGAIATMMLDASADYLRMLIKEKKRKGLFVALNVTYAQLREGDFVDELSRQIKQNRLPSKGLVLELSESEAITDEKSAKKLFAKVRAAGAGLAFDDFGAGFTSLSNLHKFTFDYLKVDKSFVEKLPGDKDAAKIVTSMAKLGKDLGLTVIAEGVSSEALADAALSSGCTLGQGFALGGPASLDGGEIAPAPERRAIAESEKTAPARHSGRNTQAGEAGQSDAGSFGVPSDPPLSSEPETPASRQFWNRDLR